MVGVGCGARSYTARLHYSREFAVGREGVRSILRDYLQRSPETFGEIDYGCRVDASEQRRRYVIKSVLRAEGLSLPGYRACFGTDPLVDLPELGALISEGFLVPAAGRLAPTQLGLDFSDAVGPRLFSPAMLAAMEGFELQ